MKKPLGVLCVWETSWNARQICLLPRQTRATWWYDVWQSIDREIFSQPKTKTMIGKMQDSVGKGAREGDNTRHFSLRLFEKSDGNDGRRCCFMLFYVWRINNPVVNSNEWWDAYKMRRFLVPQKAWRESTFVCVCVYVCLREHPQPSICCMGKLCDVIFHRTISMMGNMQTNTHHIRYMLYYGWMVE